MGGCFFLPSNTVFINSSYFGDPPPFSVGRAAPPPPLPHFHPDCAMGKTAQIKNLLANGYEPEETVQFQFQIFYFVLQCTSFYFRSQLCYIVW